MDIETKICTICGLDLPLDEFAVRKGTPTGRTYNCRSCFKAMRNEKTRERYHNDPEFRQKRYEYFRAYRERNAELVAKKQQAVRVRRYGITSADYYRMLEEQNGGCAICGLPEQSTYFKRLSVDHDHDTNKVRGLLCSECNFGLGKFKDDIDLLIKASKYLKNNSQTDAVTTTRPAPVPAAEIA